MVLHSIAQSEQLITRVVDVVEVTEPCVEGRVPTHHPLILLLAHLLAKLLFPEPVLSFHLAGHGFSGALVVVRRVVVHLNMVVCEFGET